jgi:hypothetical protein
MDESTLSNVSYQNPAVQILADEEQSPRASFSGEEFPESQKITSTRTSSKMTPEAVLLKWVNYHLKKSGSAVRVRNFSTDFKVIEFIVFLEHRLAQELEIFGLIEKILPVQIPDMQEDGTYSNYHASKCGPVMGPTNDIVVHSVEEKLLEHLDRLGLGTPLNENLTVKQVWERLMKHQAITLTGDFQSAITKLADSIVNMVADTKDAQLRARIAGGAVNVNSQDDSDTDALEIDVDGLGGLSGIGSGMRFDSDMTLNSSLNSKEGFSSLDAADDGSFLVSPNLRHSVKGTLMLSREKRIQELEEEVKLLKAENEQLKQQIQTLKKK